MIRFSMFYRIALWGIVPGIVLKCTGPAEGQPPPRPGAFVRRVLEQRPRPRDPQAIALLRRMARARVPFAGEQITEVAEQGMQTSRMRIWGDAQGRVRRDYVEPETLAGDIMLIAPGQYRYYHCRRNVVDIALWPAPFAERERQMIRLILQGVLAARRVGEEFIAGRQADIVLVSAPERQMKFWIDRETSLQLKNEISNTSGLVSRSYMTRIQIGEESGVSPALFEPSVLRQARVNPLFPPASQYRTVEEARERLPFTPLLPGVVPPGFQLTGVWVLESEDIPTPVVPGATVLLRYSDGVSSFSLYQRIAQRGRPPLAGARMGPLMRRRVFQHWRMERPDGSLLDVLYIGTLTPRQVDALYRSLK